MLFNSYISWAFFLVAYVLYRLLPWEANIVHPDVAGAPVLRGCRPERGA